MEVGVETMVTTTRLHHTITKDVQERVHTEQISLRAGDLDHGLPRWVVLQLDTPPDEWATEAIRPTAVGAATVGDGITGKEARDHPPDLAPVSPTQDMRALALARRQEDKHLTTRMSNTLAQIDTPNIHRTLKGTKSYLMCSP